MANRDCNGDLFEADGRQLYRCLLDGAVLSGMKQSDTCSHCHRKIVALEEGKLAVQSITTRFVTLSCGIRIVLSETKEEG